ncbi:hypothetical protein [Salmonella enterica]|uniref:hypothetical protein n=1 Tax=Salmonella enterica TaxID=28901 RepID=UPI0009AEF823|nr:hypothetical protein [Salmonella enterica]
MTTITKERIELFIKSPLENGLTRGEQMELARIALAALEENEFIPKNLDKALGVVGVALPESKEEFNFQIERWIQRLIDRVIRYADEFKEQPVPVVPDERAAFNAWNNEDNLPIAGVGAKNAAWLAWQARASLCGNSALNVPPERPADSSNGDDIEAWFDEGWNACRAAMLQSKYRDLSQPVDPQISEYEKIMLRAGWVMVPVEPTDEMIAAAMNCEDVLFNSDESFCVQYREIYCAMVDTAPALNKGEY